MAVGWIKLYRQIQESDLWDSEEEPFDRRSAWIDLLMLVNHEDKRTLFNGKMITVKIGQRITSIRKLAERWHWGKDRVRRFLDLLEAEEMLTRDSDNNRTLLTIVNYSKYQSQCDSDGYSDRHTDKDSNGTVTGQQRDSDGTVTGHSQATNKNDKNDIRMKKNEKNEKNEKKDIYGEYRHVRLSKNEFDRLCDDFGESLTLKAIKAVDEYVQEKGKTYKDYNLTIRRWGIDAAKKNSTEPASTSEKVDDIVAEWKAKFGRKEGD